LKPPGKGQPEPLSSIADDLDAAYTRIDTTLREEFGADVGGRIPVIVSPYPIPLSVTGKCPSALLTSDERHFVAGFTQQLDDTVRAAAARHGFQYMDTIESALQVSGRQLCDQKGLASGLNFLAFNPKSGSISERLSPASWTHNSMHPNPDGHDALRNAAAQWFRENGWQRLEPDPEASHDVGTMGDPQAKDDWRRIKQCTPADADKCQFNSGGWSDAQIERFYQSALPVLALTMIGAWLLLMPFMWFGRDRMISVAKIVRGALSKP
jgi:hypothetical protein